MSHQSRSVRLILLLGFVSILQLGCASGDQPELGQVTGTVKLDGKPLGGVAVVFQPESGRPARGMTDPEGKYELTYIRDTKGTKIGSNRVEIAPSEEDAGEEEPESSGEESAAAPPKPTSGKPKVPPKYNIRSELKADVKAGDNTFDFDLQS